MRPVTLIVVVFPACFLCVCVCVQFVVEAGDEPTIPHLVSGESETVSSLIFFKGKNVLFLKSAYSLTSHASLMFFDFYTFVYRVLKTD